MNPKVASCSHNEAVWKPAPFGCWLYFCLPCGLEAFGLTLPAAKTLFGVKAEKLKAESLREKLGRGEALTDSEQAFFAYSPFGSASRCGY
jgi:hypothetical protein